MPALNSLAKSHSKPVAGTTGTGTGRNLGLPGTNANGPASAPPKSASSSMSSDSGVARSSVTSTASTQVLDLNGSIERKENLMDLPKSLTNALFFRERLNTFIKNGWPTDKTVRCTARRLAMNWFQFEAIGEVSCVACLTKIRNLRPESDPWGEHKRNAPHCLVVKFGKPLSADWHTMHQLILLASERAINIREKQSKDAMARVESELIALKKLDLLLVESKLDGTINGSG